MKSRHNALKPVPEISEKAGDRPVRAKPNPNLTARERSPALKGFLIALVVLAVGAACIQNALHPLALVALAPVSLALLRRDYSQPFVSSESTLTGLFFFYAAAVACKHERRKRKNECRVYSHLSPSFAPQADILLILIRGIGRGPFGIVKQERKPTKELNSV